MTSEELRNSFYPWDQVINKLLTSRDPDFAEVLLRTYPIFLKQPTELLSTILGALQSDSANLEWKSKKKPVFTEKMNIIDGVLRHWLRLQDDFLVSPDLLEALGAFCEDEKSTHLISSAVRDTVYQLRFNREKFFRKSRRSKSMLPSSSSQPQVETSADAPLSPTSDLSFDKIRPEELLQALHATELQLLKDINFSEFLNQRWAQEDQAPAIHAHAQWFRAVLRWISSEIVAAADEYHQAALLSKAIQLASKSKKLQNFGGLMLFVCTLHSKQVADLTHAWGLQTPQTMQKFHKLSEFLDPWATACPYRIAYPTLSATALPVLGFLLRDLIFLDEHLPSLDGQHRVNFTKASQVFQPIQCFLRFLNAPPPTAKKSLIQALLSLRTPADLTMPTSSPHLRAVPSSFTNPPLLGLEPAPLPQGLTVRDWNIMLDGCSTKTYAAGSFILTQGVPSSTFFKITSGSVHIIKDLEIVSTLPVNCVFGEGNLLSRFGGAAFTACAAEETVVYEIPAGHIIPLFSSQPPLACHFFYPLLDNLAHRLVSAYNKLIFQIPLPTPPYSEAVKNHLLRHSKHDQIPSTVSASSDALSVSENSSSSPRASSSSLSQDDSSVDALLAHQRGPSGAHARLLPPPTLTYFRKRDHIPPPTDVAPSPPIEEPAKLSLSSEEASANPLNQDAVDPSLARNSNKDKHFCEQFRLPASEMLLAKYDIFRSDLKRRAGRLYISKNFLAFVLSDRMVREKRDIIPLSCITEVSVDEKEKLQVAATNRRQPYRFRLTPSVIQEAANFLRRLRLNSSLLTQKQSIAMPPATDQFDLSFVEPSPSETALHVPVLEPRDSFVHKALSESNPAMNDMLLTDEDKALLFQSHKVHRLQQEDVIYSDAIPASLNRLYYISEGSCSAYYLDMRDDSKKPVCSISEGSFFGLGPFLPRESSLYHSVAISSETAKIVYFDPKYLSLLFSRYPQLHARLLFTMASTVLQRIQNADTHEATYERIYPNISDLPYYLDVPRYNSSAFKRLSYPTPVCEIVGPSNDEQDERNFTFNTCSFACAKTETTYPFDPLVPPDANGKRKRLGDPICDQFFIQFYEHSVIAAIADGCSWGEAPRDAAEMACRTFVTHVQKYIGSLLDTQQLARLVLRAFSLAHHAISRGKAHLKSWEVGTTTLFAGALVPLSHMAPSSQEPSSSTAPLDSRISPPFGFVYINCGDCKGFRFSAASLDVIDITPDTRQNNDPSDCGGRLGPYIQGRDPDLRNFHLRYLPCHIGDIIFVMSDGVYDNIDPEHLGLSPKSFGIDSDSWEGIDFERAEKVRYAYRLSALRDIILKDHLRGQPLVPQVIVQRLLEFCLLTNKPSVEWMEQNPGRKLPSDFSRFPGKMDHSTVACWVVEADYTTSPGVISPPFRDGK